MAKAQAHTHLDALATARAAKNPTAHQRTLMLAAEREGGAEAARRVMKLSIHDVTAALKGEAVAPAAAARIDRYGERVAALPATSPAPYLRAVRVHAGLSVMDAARALGIATNQVQRYESGDSAPLLPALLTLWSFWRERYPGLHVEDLCGQIALPAFSSHLDALARTKESSK